MYNHTHHGHTAPPPIYSTLAEEGAPADYSTIVIRKPLLVNTVRYMFYQQMVHLDNILYGEGMVYSAVIRQDGKKTSVKVTVE